LIAQFQNANFPIAQHTLQSLPGIRVDEHIARRKDEVAIVCPVERASPDLGEIGGGNSHHNFVLDPSQQVVIAGLGFREHGCPAKVGVIHQNVHLVAVCPDTSFQRSLFTILFPSVAAAILNQILFDLVEVGANLSQSRIFFAQLLKERLEEKLKHALIEIQNFCRSLLLHFTHPGDGAFEFLGEKSLNLFQFLLVFFAQLVEIFRRDQLAIHRRS